MLVFNMILVPFTAKSKKFDILSTAEDEPAIGVSMSFLKNHKVVGGKNHGKNNGLRDPKYERDPVILCKIYLKGLFFADFLANVPICFFELFNGYKNS